MYVITEKCQGLHVMESLKISMKKNQSPGNHGETAELFGELLFKHIEGMREGRTLDDLFCAQLSDKSACYMKQNLKLFDKGKL